MTNGVAWLVLGGLASAACGKVVAPPDAAGLDDPDRATVSGTRLKLQWYDVGGARLPANALIDTALGNEACLDRRWVDGKTYCTPDARSVVFTDDQCSQPAVQEPAGTCFAQHYASTEDLASCTGAIDHLYAIGAPIATTTYYQRFSADSCDGPFTGPLRALGAEVTITALAELTPVQAPAAGLLARVFLTSADGLKLPRQIHDTMLDADCFLTTPAGSSASLCLPNDATFSSAFQDSACTIPAAVTNAICPAPRFAARSATTTCPTGPQRYLELGSPLAPTALFQTSTTGCTAREVSTSERYYSYGSEVVLATPTRSLDDQPGQAAQRILYSDGKSQFTTGFHDVVHDNDCFVNEFADGALRCSGFSASIGSYFADAACTQPIELASQFRGDPTCTPPPAPQLALKAMTPPPGNCGISIELHAVGAPYAGTAYRKFATCAPVDPDHTRAYFQLGATLSLDVLPHATRTVDP